VVPEIGAVLAAFYFGTRVLSRARVPVDPIEKLKQIPHKIRELVNAPFVVFGHSHHPVALPLGEGGWYFNTGTWLPAGKCRDHAFTHLLIRRAGGGPEASLCQWREGESHIWK
jgi:hypothetical protein